MVELGFIAITDRDLNIGVYAGPFNHGGLGLWHTGSTLVEVGVEVSVSALPRGSRRVESIDLLAQKGWTATKVGPHYNKWLMPQVGPYETDVSVSVITYNDSLPTEYVKPIISGEYSQMAARWLKIKALAKNYPYAEQQGFNGHFWRWPQSNYDMHGNNCFRFVVWMLAALNIQNPVGMVNDMGGLQHSAGLPEPVNPAQFIGTPRRK